MKELYQHPEGGGQIFFDAQARILFTANAAQCLSTYILIGPAGLRDLSAKLLTLADEMEGKQ